MDEINLLIRRLFWIIWVGPMLFRLSSKAEDGIKREHSSIGRTQQLG